jgi:hypothetical protein
LSGRIAVRGTSAGAAWLTATGVQGAAPTNANSTANVARNETRAIPGIVGPLIFRCRCVALFLRPVNESPPFGGNYLEIIPGTGRGTATRSGVVQQF